MKARRVRLLVVIAVLLVALPVGAAYAAGTGRITSPAAGATLTSATALVVEVTGDAGSLLDPQDHVVRLRLADPSGASALDGTSVVDAECQSNCSSDSTWTAGSFDPATLAPFASRPSCNGGYRIQAQVDGGAFSGHGIHVARAPGAPGDVSVTPDVGEATVTWAAAPDPDVAGYRVERRRDGGAWQAVGEVGAGERSLLDVDVDEGDVEYRVATLRGDGLVGGSPAAPCADTEPDLSTPSAPVGTTVRAASSSSPSPSGGSTTAPVTPPRPTPTPDDGDDGTSGDDGSGTDGDDDGSGTGDGTSGDTDPGTTADEDGAAGDDGSGTDGDDDGQATTARSPGNRVAPPSAMDTGSRPEVGVSESRPDDPGVASPQREETYYGEGMEFSEELDFGDQAMREDAGGQPTGSTTTTETRVVRVPGALQSMLGEELEVQRVVAPIAAGLIMLAFALHLRRWAREGIEER